MILCSFKVHRKMQAKQIGRQEAVIIISFIKFQMKFTLFCKWASSISTYSSPIHDFQNILLEVVFRKIVERSWSPNSNGCSILLFSKVGQLIGVFNQFINLWLLTTSVRKGIFCWNCPWSQRSNDHNEIDQEPSILQNVISSGLLWRPQVGDSLNVGHWGVPQ